MEDFQNTYFLDQLAYDYNIIIYNLIIKWSSTFYFVIDCIFYSV